MNRLFHAMLLFLASPRNDDAQRVIEYLKAENDILRGLHPKPLRLPLADRQRLASLAAGLGPLFAEIVRIVHPDTMRRWIRQSKGDTPPAKQGRPRLAQAVRDLILKFAFENPWGYERIQGELLKLGVTPISLSTIKRVVKAHGVPPHTRRTTSTWRQFLAREAATYWQCDFFSRRILTLSGYKHAFLLVFIHVKTRQVVISPATHHPNDAWVTQQTQAFLAEAQRRGLPVHTLQRDRDAKFASGFHACLAAAGVKEVKTAVRAPRMNAFIERFLRSLAYECLEHFVVLGLRHLDYLCREYADYYHHDRPHQGLGNALITPLAKSPKPVRFEDALRGVQCRSRLGGLYKTYHRHAA